MANKVALYISVIVVLGVSGVLILLSNLEIVNFSPFNVSVSVGNSAPVVDFVGFTNIGANPGGIANVLINFNVSDGNGVNDLNNTSTKVELINTGFGVNRFNTTCINVGDIDGDTRNYNCEVELWYFDHYGQYIVNVTIRDNANNLGANSTELFNYQQTTSFTIYPNGLIWPAITTTSVNINSSNDPLIGNNSGNTPLSVVNLTGYDLPGAITAGAFIYAGNFSVGVVDNCAGDIMQNDTGKIISGGSLNIGNLSIGGGTAQEELYFCIKAINTGTPSESYSTTNAGGTSWKLDFQI